ncbi:MAG: hypothetical protein KDA61_02455 [Planctomycetales bacterium]|nr:hypothetical protein [Planctomycetales bacterium]
MIDEDLLSILRCPVDHSALHAADQETVARLNEGIAAGSIVNVSGDKVERSLSGGLIREAGDLLYPIVDEIPLMLADEAIRLDQADA